MKLCVGASERIGNRAGIWLETLALSSQRRAGFLHAFGSYAPGVAVRRLAQDLGNPHITTEADVAAYLPNHQRKARIDERAQVLSLNHHRVLQLRGGHKQGP